MHYALITIVFYSCPGQIPKGVTQTSRSSLSTSVYWMSMVDLSGSRPLQTSVQLPRYRGLGGHLSFDSGDLKE